MQNMEIYQSLLWKFIFFFTEEGFDFVNIVFII